MDKAGRPRGGKQVFKYRTKDELIEKLTKANSAASVRIRELASDQKLVAIVASGTTPKVPLPTNEVPETLREMATELRAVRESNFMLAVNAAIANFTNSVDWQQYRSKENAETVVLAVERAGDDPTDVASFHKAFAAMKNFILPVGQPVAALRVEPTPAPTVQPSRTTKAYGTPTGLSAADGGDERHDDILPAVSNTPTFYTAAQLDRMPSHEMRKLLMNSRTQKMVEAVYEQKNQRKAASRG